MTNLSILSKISASFLMWTLFLQERSAFTSPQPPRETWPPSTVRAKQAKSFTRSPSRSAVKRPELYKTARTQGPPKTCAVLKNNLANTINVSAYLICDFLFFLCPLNHFSWFTARAVNTAQTKMVSKLVRDQKATYKWFYTRNDVPLIKWTYQHWLAY